MKKLTKKELAQLTERNARLEPVIRAIGEQMGKQFADALGHFAARYGIDWASELILQWYSGKDANFRDAEGNPQGHYLRSIRNSPVHGVAFYDAYNGE